MPPRFAYWTIILEGKPTAFRAQHRDELLPTFRQLQSRHPDVVLKWFARGRLWESPEEAWAAQRGSSRERRPPEWRPGGEHRDPRARFKVPRDIRRSRIAVKLRRESRDRDDRFDPARGAAGARPPADRGAEGGRQQRNPRAGRPKAPSAPAGDAGASGRADRGRDERPARQGRHADRRSVREGESSTGDTSRPPFQKGGPRPKPRRQARTGGGRGRGGGGQPR